MLAVQGVAYKPTVLVEFRSSAGPTVTHVRGGIVVQSIASLRALGLYERYLERLDAEYRDQLLYTISASWITLEVGMAHLNALDALDISDAAAASSGDSVGTGFGKTMYSAMMKATRSIGTNAGWFVLKQCDRLLPRVYTGGACTLLQTGPKDAVLELHGMPMVHSRFFRSSHHGYMKALSRLMGRGAYVRVAHPRERHPHSIATAFSWV
jgi:hypothetical protein